MSLIGVYFGLKTINGVEVSGRKILNSMMIPRSAVSGNTLEDKVTEDVKIVALLKEEMRKHAITAKDAALCLSGKDLIVRNFEIPMLPSEELASAVSFEAKKYLPFKMEELCYDFQLQVDKVSRRNLVLFVGIKKEVMELYLSIVSQLGLKVTSLEYSGFSLLRFMHLTGASTRGIVGVISVDFQDEDEVHFTILENGFPLFSRDITLLGRPEEFTNQQPQSAAVQMDKLKTEIRISLDYYDRKLPTKNIEKAYLICPQDLRATMEATMKEVTLPVHFLDSGKYMSRQATFNLSVIKSYGCALNKSVRMPLKLNLLAARTRVTKETTEAAGSFSFLKGLKLSPWSVVLGGLVIAGAVLYGKYRTVPLQREISALVALRPQIEGINTGSSSAELEGLSSNYQQRIKSTKILIDKEIRLTSQLDSVVRALPDGAWLLGFTYRNDGTNLDLTLNGAAMGMSAEQEVGLVNVFHTALRKDPVISRWYSSIDVTSVQRTPFPDSMEGTLFTIVCKGEARPEGGSHHGA